MIDGTAADTRLSLHAKAWAEEYELIDSQLSPLGLQAMDGLNLLPGETVLDVGCGTGQTLLQVAERVGEQGRIYGVDISRPLLKVALELSDRADAVFWYHVVQ